MTKDTLKGVGGTILVIALALLAARGYDWKRHTDIRTFYAAQSAAYLFNPSGLVNAKGDAVTRQELLDLFLEQVVKDNPQLGLHFTKSGS